MSMKSKKGPAFPREKTPRLLREKTTMDSFVSGHRRLVELWHAETLARLSRGQGRMAMVGAKARPSVEMCQGSQRRLGWRE